MGPQRTGDLGLRTFRPTRCSVGRDTTITEADRETGRVIFHHGGRYTVDGDRYTEHIEYAHPNTAGLVGRALEFEN